MRYAILIALLAVSVRAQTIHVTHQNINDLNPEAGRLYAPEGAQRIKASFWQDGMFTDPANIAGGLPSLTITAADGYRISVLSVASNEPPNVVWWVVPFLGPGEYTFNIAGGSGVGPGSASINVPARSTTNLASITTVNRSNSLRVTYTPTPQADFIQIMGISLTNVETDAVGAMFFCHASASAGSFDVPASVLSLLPPSDVVEGFPVGFIGLGVGTFKEASISGLDQSFITQMDMEQRTTRYQ